MPNLGPPRCESRVGNPVDASIGNKYELFDGYGANYFGVQFFISYNSLDPRLRLLSPLGNKFRHVFERSLEISEDQIQAHRHDGKMLVFQKQAGEWVLAGSETHGLLSQTSTGYRHILEEGVVEEYDQSGLLLSLRNIAGGGIDFEYDLPLGAGGDGRDDSLDRAVDQRGRVISFGYQVFPGPTTTPYYRLTTVNVPGGQLDLAFDQPYGRLRSIGYPGGHSKKLRFRSTEGVQYFLLRGVTDESDVDFSSFIYSTNSDLATTTEHSGDVDRYTFNYGASSTTVGTPLGAIFSYRHQKVADAP